MPFYNYHWPLLSLIHQEPNVSSLSACKAICQVFEVQLSRKLPFKGQHGETAKSIRYDMVDLKIFIYLFTPVLTLS